MIAEYHINKLKEVEPLMFRAGESSGIDKTFMTRTYVQGLIARMALMEGGYQTRRSDLEMIIIRILTVMYCLLRKQAKHQLLSVLWSPYRLGEVL